MAISVKLRCSECETFRETELKREDEEILCLACGRRMANLTAGEHAEMEKTQKSQRMLSIVSIVLFVFALVCVLFWAADGCWISGKTLTPDGKLTAAEGAVEANIAPFIGAIVFTLAALVTGVMGSMKRFLVEF